MIALFNKYIFRELSSSILISLPIFIVACLIVLSYRYKQMEFVSDHNRRIEEWVGEMDVPDMNVNTDTHPNCACALPSPACTCVSEERQ
jgi:hypothetical protein